MQSEVDPEDYLDFMRIHKNFVEKNLHEFRRNQKVLSKYVWLKTYHNDVVHERLSGKRGSGLTI
jgi:hypothetical protein